MHGYTTHHGKMQTGKFSFKGTLERKSCSHYYNIFFQLPHVSYGPSIITIKGAAPIFNDDTGKFDPPCGRNLEIWSSL